jgi:hypothetical protein
MSTDLMNISQFKGLAPAAAFAAALDPHAESLSDGIGSSYGIVGYKGKVWTLRLRGQFMSYASVEPDFLRFLGVELVAGRQFTADDNATHPPVVIINEALARRAWPGSTRCRSSCGTSMTRPPRRWR